MKKFKIALLLTSFLSVGIANADVNIFEDHVGNLYQGSSLYCEPSININAKFQKFIGASTIKMLEFHNQTVNLLATATNHTDSQYIYNIDFLKNETIGKMNVKFKQVVLRDNFIAKKQNMIVYLTNENAPPFAQNCTYISQ